MRIWTEPRVVRVGGWVFTGHPEYEVPDDGDQVTRGLSFAAKGCYRSFGKDGRGCVANQLAVMEHGHESVLEHAAVTLHVEGVSRALSLEMNRHRFFGISQESTRYVDLTDAGIVLEPFIARLWENPANEVEQLIVSHHVSSAAEALRSYRDHVTQLEEYNPRGLEGFELRKWARGLARNLLPHALETKVTYTGNIRAWRHFLKLRSAPGAEAEIRRLCSYIHPVLKEYAPLYFDFEETLHDGFPVYT